MESEQFELGRLTGEVRNLSASLAAMRTDIEGMRVALESLKIWKGQIMVASGITSFIFSGVFYLLGLALEKWSR